jgi:hypothetical protein
LTAHRGINLNVHKAADLRQWAASREWLTMYCLPLEADAALTEAGDYRDQILD